jgi:hypothetical protein
MTIIIAILAIAFIAGLVIGGYALLAPRTAVRTAQPLPPLDPWKPTTEWTTQAGAEFAGLAEPARCDLIFAVSGLQDERSQQLLIHALDDPSDAVALAAAHALVRRGDSAAVDDYMERHPGERSARLARTLELLN